MIEKNKNNIILIGMPGAGKSTIGVLLAKAITYNFIDTDISIQQREKNQLYKIIDEMGLDAFIKIENDVLSRLEVDGCVIATGGSAVYGQQAMEHLRSIGTVVYIKLGLDEILKRVNNITTRGIAMKKGMALEDVYKERVPLYEKYADIIVDAEGTSIEECVEKVVKRLAP
ncbi:MAG: shikimate kinase [Lachnospiraceae bacterium]|nr:shikimate kinase [Candidatus Colinaster equi]